MKKIFAILIALTLILTACGGDSGESGGKTAADITADNWTSIVAECFGLELSLPEGWSVKSARSPNGVTNVELIFTVGGDATYATFGESLFAELKKDASGDITKYAGEDVYADFASAAGSMGIASFTAKVDGESGKSLVINYFDDGATVSMTLLRMGNWETK